MAQSRTEERRQLWTAAQEGRLDDVIQLSDAFSNDEETLKFALQLSLQKDQWDVAKWLMVHPMLCDMTKILGEALRIACTSDSLHMVKWIVKNTALSNNGDVLNNIFIQLEWDKSHLSNNMNISLALRSAIEFADDKMFTSRMKCNSISPHFGQQSMSNLCAESRPPFVPYLNPSMVFDSSFPSNAPKLKLHLSNEEEKLVELCGKGSLIEIKQQHNIDLLNDRMTFTCALDAAVRNSQLKVIKWLITSFDLGQDVTILKDSLQEACHSKNKEVVMYLQTHATLRNNHDALNEVYENTIQDGEIDVWSWMIKHFEMNVNYVHKMSGNTVLHYAICYNGSTLLHQACGEGNMVEVFTMLYEHIYEDDEGDDGIINKQDNCGNTPLHVAYMADNTDLVELLIFAGADETIYNYDRCTAAQMNRNLDGETNTTLSNLYDVCLKCITTAEIIKSEHVQSQIDYNLLKHEFIQYVATYYRSTMTDATIISMGEECKIVAKILGCGLRDLFYLCIKYIASKFLSKTL